LYFCLALLAARSNSLQATLTWSMPPTYLTWSQIIHLATKVSACRWTSSACLFTEKPLSTSAWPCERTSNILTTFHNYNLLYTSLPAMASRYPLWTWLGQNSQNGFIPCQSWKLHTRCAGIITSVMNILIFRVSSHIFHDLVVVLTGTLRCAQLQVRPPPPT